MRAARYLFALAALLLLACAAVWFIAPAALAVAWLNDASHGMLQLSDASGTLHDGRGRIGDRAGRWSIPVAWSLDAGMLWRGTLVVHLGSATDSVHATLRISRSGVDARDVDVSIPAAVATSMLPPMIALNAGGTVVVTSDALALGEQTQGSAHARWLQARLADAGGNALDFGTVSAELRAADDGSATVTMAGAGGDTALDGSAHLAANRIDADLTLMPRTGAPLPLLQSLAAFGAARPGGGASFAYHGEWTRARR